MFNKKVQKVLVSGMLAAALTVSAVPMGEVASVFAATDNSDLSMNQLSISLASPQKSGTTLTLSAECEGGYGDLTYTYRVLLPDGTWEIIAQDTSCEHVDYTVSQVGSYNFSVDVSDGYDTVTDVKEFQVTPAKVTINSVKLNKSSYSIKDKMKVSVSATASAGKVKSKIVLTKPNGRKVTVKGYSTKMSGSYQLKKKGTYKDTVYVKDAATTAKKSKTITVK